MKTCDESLPELIGMYDKDNLNTFVSLYFDGKDDCFIQHREKVIQTILKPDESKNFLKTMDVIKKHLKNNKVENHAIFASDKYNFFKTISFSMNVKNSLSVDVSPYIHQIAELADEWQTHTLVLLNSNHAKIFSFSCGEIHAEGDLSADIMNKHKKGGMSQARFQRLRKGNIHAFLTEVVEALQKIAQDNIILAGPGETKKQFRDLLPIMLQKNIIAEVNVDIDDEYGLFKETHEIMIEKGKQDHRLLLELIQTEILKNGLAVYGIKDTLVAVKNGQVEALLAEKGVTQKGWICEHCQILDDSIVSLCPRCGKETSEVNIIEEIIKIAERTGATVGFSQDEIIKKIGPVVGLLRYK